MEGPGSERDKNSDRIISRTQIGSDQGPESDWIKNSDQIGSKTQIGSDQGNGSDQGPRDLGKELELNSFVGIVLCQFLAKISRSDRIKETDLII